MQKPSLWLIATSTIFSLIVATQNAGFARSQRPPENMPICYLRTPRQQMVDLTRLCDKNALPSKPQVTVLSAQRVGDRVIGSVRNDTGKPVRYAIVNYTIATQSSPPAEVSRFAYVTPEVLAPGQIATFEETLNELGNIRVISVEWEGQQKQAS
ncbi:MAG: hypothetical protein HC780_26430 [Leptolyngbyaceae cyanobacterium CSU_1_3]|nr:hypothetical protein [Leptolyngbyaceae cyanobacterium CSU_1_3]